MTPYPYYSHLLGYYSKLTNPAGGNVDLSNTEVLWTGSITNLYLLREDYPEGLYLVNGSLVHFREGQTTYGGASSGGGWNWANVYWVQVQPSGANWLIRKPFVGHYAGTRFTPITSVIKIG